MLVRYFCMTLIFMELQNFYRSEESIMSASFEYACLSIDGNYVTLVFNQPLNFNSTRASDL